METIYRGVTIKYKEKDNIFECETAEFGYMSNISLAVLKHKLDLKFDADDKSVKMKPISILKFKEWGCDYTELCYVKITSFGIRESNYRNSDILMRVTNWHGDNKSTIEDEQYSNYKMYENTPENESKMQQIVILQQEIDAYKKLKKEEQDALIKKLTKYKVQLTDAEKAELPLWKKW